ncbi:hypothetical protein [Pectobacterium atrosepticum]|uniref:ApeA N-terminal domain 1-containing protein n=1 Tax=Pectobacterium atrosepticum TaxID=29471 RepID=UPI000499CE68|nr:hypothetical protein [Pectobacterium atrosepticum]AIA69716.1 hypothetical protein EV46_03760 [Pectobacterium atrosepticum]AIK12625.1 hypothetical protein GZ59_07560 [Pectobacterium atrosepticum]POW23673.1 hypothetical protein PB72LOC_04428 [Pectobacterium atrosepticum]
MKNIKFYGESVDEHRKGVIRVDGEDYPADLKITQSNIEIRFFDFSCKMNRDFSDLLNLKTAVFNGSGGFFRLFGMELNESSFRFIEPSNSFNDYTFSASGFLYSSANLNDIEMYQVLRFYSSGIKNWLGNTEKLNKIINRSILNKLPEQEDLVEFERGIKDVGTVGGYYGYRYGGLDGLHTVGMSVTPHITLHLENKVDLNGLLERYTDLYMLMRFLIGRQLDFTDVKVRVSENSRHSDISLYFPERKSISSELHNSMSLLYSSVYNDGSEKKFPLQIFDNYFHGKENETNLLVKKFINYSLIDSDEERFLGFYRIIERSTFKQSYYVDKNKLSVLLDRSRSILQKTFHGSSISEFKRAVMRVNGSKENTETCIRHYIKNLPEEFVVALGLDKIKIDALCRVRNNIIHQPLFSVSISKLHDCMVISRILAFVILMEKLGIPYGLIEEVANLNRWKGGISYLI